MVTHRKRMVMTLLTTITVNLIVVLLLGGCAQTRIIDPPGPGHPASVASPSVAFSPPANPFATAIGVPDDAAVMDAPTHDMSKMSHEEAAPAGGLTVYSCPMHADVRSDRSGDCPKCGMALMPVQARPPHGTDHGGSP